VRIVVAPDSFKGSASATEVAAAIRRGWLEVRPGDEVVALPLADGGEGTLDAFAGAVPLVRRREVRVDGPAGPATAPWLLTEDGTAVVELAAACGLPLWPEPRPLDAHTYALGQVLRDAASDQAVDRIVVAVGGSASTDGGTGALTALGARFLDRDGRPIPLGGIAMQDLTAVDLEGLLPPPARVDVLVDVEAPLLGPLGAAAQFGPQKGASRDDVRALEQALARLATVLGGDPEAAGSGAAGGTAYGLATAWGATLVPGASSLARLAGLGAALDGADLVVTGEGRLDAQSFRGKVVGNVVGEARSRGVEAWACVGQADDEARTGVDRCVDLVSLAGSADLAMRDPDRWLQVAGRTMAGQLVTP
jgi:glycerate 2-kinase